MSACVLSPKWLGLLVIVSLNAQAVLRSDDSGATTSGGGATGGSLSASSTGVGGTTFSGQSQALPAGVTVRGPGGAPQGAPGAEGGGGGGGGGGGSEKKSPGGAIGNNIKAVNAILNPEAKDKGSQTAPPPPDPMTQEDLRDILLDISVGSYPGYCPCPYNRNVDGFECGIEAAYYKPGGYRIKCYPQDLRGQEYIFYRKNH